MRLVQMSAVRVKKSFLNRNPAMNPLNLVWLLERTQKIISESSSHIDIINCTCNIDLFILDSCRWLYWIDRMLHTMSRASVVGNTSAVVMRTNLECGWPLTIDHRSGKVFWSDYCTYRIESLDIDGSNYSVVVDSNIQHIVLFSYGIAKYGNMLYWTQPTRIYSLDLKPGSPTTMLYTGSSSQPLRTLHVVHPSQQPSGKY